MTPRLFDAKAAVFAMTMGAVFAAVLWASIAKAQVTYVYTRQGVSAQSISLQVQPDGGCLLSACGIAKAVDGGGPLPLCVNNIRVSRGAFVARCAAFADVASDLISASLGAGSDGGAP